jgi:hypothetical protein
VSSPRIRAEWAKSPGSRRTGDVAGRRENRVPGGVLVVDDGFVAESLLTRFTPYGLGSPRLLPVARPG